MKLKRRSDTLGSGDMRARITMLQPTYTADGRGGQTVTFAAYSTVWAKAEPKTESRRLQEAQVTYNDAYDFTIRFSEMPLTADWMIRYKGRDYTIHPGIHDIEDRHQYWSILAYTKKL